jgi:cell division transport system permease protein
MMRFRYVLTEVLTGLWRNVTMTIAMIITMTVSLSMLGAALLVYIQVNDMRDFYYDKIEVSIFLKGDITDDQRASLQNDLKNDALVQTVFHETKEQAFERFKTQFRDAPDLVNATKPDSLPESFRVKLKDPKKVTSLADEFRSRDGVSEIVDQQQLLKKVFSILSSLQRVALIAALFQGIAAALLVANTIQVAAYSKRREVAVMKLVGASNWFIQLPFVLEAVFAGLIGAVIAFLGLVLTKWFIIDGSLKPLTTLLTPVAWRTIWIQLPILAGAASVVSAITGWVTLRFYVRV